MLDMSFYSDNRKLVGTVSFQTNFYEWLIQSGFTKIANSVELEMILDDEPTEIRVIPLEGRNRIKFSDFFRDLIVEDDEDMLNKLGDSPSPNEYKEAISKRKTLHEIRKNIENEEMKYLGHVE